jgi:hypothetical protein
MKQCSKCLVVKQDDAFARELSRGKIRSRPDCKECRKKYLRGYYANNSEYFATYRADNSEVSNHKAVECARRSRHERYHVVQELKSDKPCLDCAQILPWYVMDFDHRDPSSKLGEISTMVKTYVPWSRVLEEIAKCDLVCACCHRLRTYKGNNSYRTRLYVRNKQLVDALKEASPCLDCKVSFKACQMDFDHVRGDKSGTVSQMLGCETNVLTAEIAKCDLVCANCHRARTFSRPAPQASKKLVLSDSAKGRQRASYQRNAA